MKREAKHLAEALMADLKAGKIKAINIDVIRERIKKDRYVAFDPASFESEVCRQIVNLC